MAGLDRLPRHLQQQALLGVHQLDFIRGEGKEGGVKAVDAAQPAAKAGLQGGLAVLGAAGGSRGAAGRRGQSVRMEPAERRTMEGKLQTADWAPARSRRAGRKSGRQPAESHPGCLQVPAVIRQQAGRAGGAAAIQA